jgi:hypothetical protein
LIFLTPFRLSRIFKVFAALYDDGSLRVYARIQDSDLPEMQICSTSECLKITSGTSYQLLPVGVVRTAHYHAQSHPHPHAFSANQSAPALKRAQILRDGTLASYGVDNVAREGGLSVLYV